VGRILLVSNRLPITISIEGNDFRFESSIGGLATGLGSFYKSRDCLWIGWPGIDQDQIKGCQAEIEAELLEERCYPVFIPKKDIDSFYDGFCNTTIWPLFHYLPLYTAYREDWWGTYQRVNEAFANAIAEVADPDDTIWIHDYQLMLVPELVRERLPNSKIGFFLHIPFPSFEVFRALPWRTEILYGLLGADLVGFHTYDYQHHFLQNVHRLLGLRSAKGQISAVEKTVQAGTFPMGINYEQYSSAALQPDALSREKEFHEIIGDRKIILSIDRLDYTKGIPQRLKAYSLFLKQCPQYKEKVILVCVVVPSRMHVEQYSILKNEIDEIVGAINGEHGTIGWVPIQYFFRSLDFNSMIALYNMADVALVTPIRDGMNLIAKEYLATKTSGKGALILTETAGAAQELGEAIIINPNDIKRMALAIREALEMPENKQIESVRAMQERLSNYTVMKWAEEFVGTLNSTVTKRDITRIIPLKRKQGDSLVREFEKANRRLLLLDYDGTLIPFSDHPADAKPGSEQLQLLKHLACDPRTEVVLISGRDRATLERWFADLAIGMVAEHGVWVKERGGEWQIAEGLEADWKKDIRPILQMWSDRSPGSFVEEKEFSLVWHYRKTEKKLGDMRAKELTSHLDHITADHKIEILVGNKVIEIKNASIDKGQAAQHWLSRGNWDWIMAMGDDWTDEDIFKVLPQTAWSIKVGFHASAARYHVNSTRDVLTLLRAISSRSRSVATEDHAPDMVQQAGERL